MKHFNPITLLILTLVLAVRIFVPSSLVQRRSTSATVHRVTESEHHGKHARSREVTAEFERENPCPATGKRYGACPGYIKDHIHALCIGGVDEVSNLQWQTKADAAAKDRWECNAADPRNQ
jgi:hypothetical protein